MDGPATSLPGLEDQQVMTAQAYGGSMIGVHMEGESSGPAYGENLVASADRPQHSGNSSLQDSPSGFISAPWSPQRAQQVGFEGSSSDMRVQETLHLPVGQSSFVTPDMADSGLHGPSQAAASNGLPRWMLRLGEFVRHHTAGSVETLTAITRQHVHVSSDGSVGGSSVVQQQRQLHLQQSTSSPTNQLNRQAAAASATAAGDLPLFGPEARHRMEAWSRQAPLLHGSAVGQDDDDSSGSIPRELVQEEVRRQVAEAMRVQQAQISELRLENERLCRGGIAAGNRDRLMVQDGLGRELPHEDGARSRIHEGQDRSHAHVQSMQSSSAGLVPPGVGLSGGQGHGHGSGPLAQPAIHGVSPGDRAYAAAYGADSEIAHGGGYVRDAVSHGDRAPVMGSGATSGAVVPPNLPMRAQEREVIDSVPLPPSDRTSGARHQQRGFIGRMFGSGSPQRPDVGYSATSPKGSSACPQPSPPPGLQQTEPSEQFVPGVKGAATSSNPSPIDIVLSGMGQIQQLLLERQRGSVGDLEKSTVDLPVLPEYQEEQGASDLQDWLFVSGQMIGALASDAATWWSGTLKAAEAAYEEYMSKSPIERLRYSKLERRVSTMILAALPVAVKGDPVANRTRGVHQQLFRLLTLCQPGSAQDKAVVIRQLDIHESSDTPAHAAQVLRKWYRTLQRAADLSISVPDPSVQAKSLLCVIKKLAAASPDLQFRVSMARNDLQVDVRPSQESVIKLYQHLLAEMEQLNVETRRSNPTRSTPNPDTPKLKGMDGNGQPAAKAKASSPPLAAPDSKPCKWFRSQDGCRKGKDCKYGHSWDGLIKAERCLTCVSTLHRAKECPRKPVTANTATPASFPSNRRSPGQSAADSSAASGNQTRDQPQIQQVSAGHQASTSTSPASPASPDSKSGVADLGGTGASSVAEMIAETNKVLRALVTPPAEPAPAAGPSTVSSVASSDPLVTIQRQIDEIRRLRALRLDQGVSMDSVLMQRVQAHEQMDQARFALLDSGASHAFRAAQSKEEYEGSKRVVVSLATGEGTTMAQNPGGTLLGSPSSSCGAILPLGQLVRLLGCSIKWSKNKLEIIHPIHGKLVTRVRADCPEISEAKALELIHELEMKRLSSFSSLVDQANEQLYTLQSRGLEGFHWEDHLTQVVKTGERAHMCGLVNKIPYFAAVPPEFYIDIPESFPVTDKDGWQLLKSFPWSRRKRRTMFKSSDWVVHLFSGERHTGVQQRLRDSVWNASLVEDDVLVEIDITQSKSFDLARQKGVFQLLCWAASQAKLKALVGGPPRRSIWHDLQFHPIIAQGKLSWSQGCWCCGLWHHMVG